MIPLIFIVFFSLLYRVSVLIIEKTFLLKKNMLIIGKYSFGIYMIHFL
jgi:peptidoglycan/LPS O-acetylase OafA/YrhL